jgi:hypothetical protein
MHDFIIREIEIGTRAAICEDSEACGYGALFDLSYAEYVRQSEPVCTRPGTEPVQLTLSTPHNQAEPREDTPGELSPAEPGRAGYPTFDDNPADWGLSTQAWGSQAEADAAESLEIWGPNGPYIGVDSYQQFLTDGKE